jgi:hypothetical protein
VRISGLTPAPPMTGPMSTPAPGSIPTPMAGQPMLQPTAYTPTPPPGTNPFPATPPGGGGQQYGMGQYGTAAAAPTAVGTPAQHQLTPTPTPTPYPAQTRSKAPIIVAALVVVVAAVIAIVFAVRKKTAEEPVANPPATVDAAIEKKVTPDAPDKVVKTGSNDGSATKVDEGSGKTPGTGSDAKTGSAGSAVTAPKVSKITLVSTPPGAKIYINGVELEQVTPQPFEVPLSDKPIKIVLKLDGYKDIVFEKMVPNQNINEERAFQKKPKYTPDRPPGKGSGSSTPPGPGSAKTPPNTGSGSGKRGSNDTGLIKPE